MTLGENLILCRTTEQIKGILNANLQPKAILQPSRFQTLLFSLEAKSSPLITQDSTCLPAAPRAASEHVSTGCIISSAAPRRGGDEPCDSSCLLHSQSRHEGDGRTEEVARGDGAGAAEAATTAREREGETGRKRRKVLGVSLLG